MTRYVQGPRHAKRGSYVGVLPWVALAALIGVVVCAIALVLV